MDATCTEHGIGELYIAGDYACEHAELSVLNQVAERLIEHAPEPLHCELEPLVHACTDPQRATEAWTRLKERVQLEATRS